MKFRQFEFRVIVLSKTFICSKLIIVEKHKNRMALGFQGIQQKDLLQNLNSLGLHSNFSQIRNKNKKKTREK